MFLVGLVLVGTVSCEYFGEPNLHFDSNTEYASKYDNYQPRDYHFDYAVSDPHTGDHKSQWEVKKKGVVRGSYSLLEPDGTTRVVDYIADDNGFRAVVKKLGVAIHPEHVETHGQPLQLIEQPVPEISHYGTYDGQIDNYANVLGTVQHLQPVGVPHSYQSQVVEPIPYQLQQPLAYQQQQISHEPVQSYPVPIEVQQGQLVGDNQHLISQVQEIQQPLAYQNQLISPEPIQSYPASIELQQSQLLGDGQHLISQSQGIQQPWAYGLISQEPVQSYPVSQGLNNNNQHLLSQSQLAGYGGEGLQGQYLGDVESRPAAPIAPVQSELVPIGPSYHTSVQYGLTGNPEDDSRYVNYGEPGQSLQGYHAEASQKVQKAVPAPIVKGHSDTKRAHSVPRQFLIYYPDPESP